MSRSAPLFLGMRRSRSKAAMLAPLIWLGCGAAGAAVGWYQPPSLVDQMTPRRTPQWAQLTMENDPQAGRVFSLPPLYDLEGNRVTVPLPGRPTCVMFTWHCSQCQVRKKIRSLSTLLSQTPGARMQVIVIRGRPEAVRKLWDDIGVASVPVAIDRSGDVARKLNAAFPQRVYFFDSAGRLLYLSPYGESQKGVERRISQLLAAERRLAEVMPS